MMQLRVIMGGDGMIFYSQDGFLCHDFNCWQKVTLKDVGLINGDTINYAIINII